MHICVVGTGAAGWMTAHYLNKLNGINKITLVGSDEIPHIGVGESTTRAFPDYLKHSFGFDANNFNRDFLKFLVDIDAAYKYGVSYRGWSQKEFLHVFNYITSDSLKNYMLLGNKPSEDNVNLYTNINATTAYQNKITKTYKNLDEDLIENWQSSTHTYHFDANKFINTFKKLAEGCEKINHIIGTAVDLIYENDIAKTLILKDGRMIDADYFVSCIGQTAFNQKVFREEYESYSDVLLTNKAVVTPLEYTDKPKEFHPYTVAKTMKCGWRWITPTWSRIGTGYVFSDNHISVDEATQEFKNDIGRQDIEPFVVDFYPRRAKNSFKKNTCTIGMAAGFLEPLDAPGLALTSISLSHLKNILEGVESLEMANKNIKLSFDSWAAFILLQYRTSFRNDTEFWKDHKNIKFPLLEDRLEQIFEEKLISWDIETYPDKIYWQTFMFYNTIAGKDIKWNVSSGELPKKIDVNQPIATFDHFEYMSGIHKRFSST
jgi:tryptophan halogenase